MPGRSAARWALWLPLGLFLSFVLLVVGGLLRPAGVRAFNALYWRASPRRERGRPLALVPYFFPLDGVADWNRLYGPAGLIQYQLVVPSGQEAALARWARLSVQGKCHRIHRTRQEEWKMASHTAG